MRMDDKIYDIVARVQRITFEKEYTIPTHNKRPKGGERKKKEESLSAKDKG